MYEKISTAGMNRAEWLELRRTGIGGSDAGAVCGVNPYSSGVKVFRDKTGGGAEEQVSEAVRIGHDLEEYVAQRFTEVTGRKVRKSNFMYRSVEYPFMIADVDRLIIGEDAGLECKTASAYNMDQWKDGNIPLHYIMQCYHYMAVTGKKTWYLAALILGKEFTYRKLIWDDELIGSLIETERNFWENHVLKEVFPPPDGSGACDAVLDQYFHAVKKSKIKLTGFDEKLDRRKKILDAVSQLQEEQKRIEQEIKLYMKENEIASSEKYHVSWNEVNTIRLDTKRLREEKPEIYRDYSVTSSSRRFQIKAA